MLTVSIHVALGKNVEIRLEAAAGTNIFEHVEELEVLLLCLVSKLVRRKSQNHKFRVGTIEGIHLLEIPDCCTSQRRDVLNHHNFPGVFREGDR